MYPGPGVAQTVLDSSPGQIITVSGLLCPVCHTSSTAGLPSMSSPPRPHSLPPVSVAYAGVGLEGAGGSQLACTAFLPTPPGWACLGAELTKITLARAWLCCPARLLSARHLAAGLHSSIWEHVDKKKWHSTKTRLGPSGCPGLACPQLQTGKEFGSSGWHQGWKELQGPFIPLVISPHMFPPPCSC